MTTYEDSILNDETAVIKVENQEMGTTAVSMVGGIFFVIAILLFIMALVGGAADGEGFLALIMWAIVGYSFMYANITRLIISDKAVYAKPIEGGASDKFLRISFDELHSVEMNLSQNDSENSKNIYLVTKDGFSAVVPINDNQMAFSVKNKLKRYFVKENTESDKREGSNSCGYCGASFVTKMSQCPHCGGKL